MITRRLFSSIEIPSCIRRCTLTNTECKDPDCTRCVFPIVFQDQAREAVGIEKKPKKKSEDQ